MECEISDVFWYYLQRKKKLKWKTKKVRMNQVIRSLLHQREKRKETKPGVKLADVTAGWLKKVKKERMNKACDLSLTASKEKRKEKRPDGKSVVAITAVLEN